MNVWMMIDHVLFAAVERGSKVLVYRGYKYLKVKLNSIFWRCSKNCGVYTNDFFQY